MPPRRKIVCPSHTTAGTRPYLPFRVGCGTDSISASSSSPTLPERLHFSYPTRTATRRESVDSISPTTGATSKANKRKWNAAIWKHYDCYNGDLFEDGQHRAICKYCKGGAIKVIPREGTSNFIRHYQTCEFFGAMNDASHDGILLQRFDKNAYKEMIALAIIRHGYPFTFAEHEGNRNIHSFLHEGFKPISGNTAKNHVMKIHEREKDRLRGLMHKVSGKICLTSDLWTSVVDQGYISLTAHFIDDEWNLNAKVLDFCHVQPPYTAAKLHDRVLDLLNNWGIENKVFSITVDNARCNENMQGLLSQSLSMHNSLPCAGEYFHVRCSAHILNLIVQEGLKVIDDALIKVRKLIVWTVGSELRKLKFKESAVYVGIDCSKNLCLGCPTGWNSTYKMLERAVVYRKAFERSTNRSDPTYPPLPNDGDWSRVEKICALLRPFDELTTLMSGSHYATANLYFSKVWNIELLLMKYASCDDEFLRSMALNMRVKFDKYWASYSIILSFAVMLDPRYKFQLVLYCFKELNAETSLAKAENVKSQFYKLYDEYAMAFKPKHQATTGEVQDTRRDVLKGFSNFECSFEEKTELDAYLDAGRIDYTKELDVLNWWKENESKYPVVSQMAKDILAIPITTVASESAFSMGSRVLIKWRAFLDPDTADALLSTRSWLFGFDLEGDSENQEVHGLEFPISANHDYNEDGEEEEEDEI